MEEFIELHRGEYEEIPEGVRTMVSTIIKKLPGPQRKTYAQRVAHVQASQKEAELVQAGCDAGIMSAWLQGNAGLYDRERSGGALLKLLVELQQLRAQYGTEALNAGLLKATGYDDPQKCTIPYLKAILKSSVGQVGRGGQVGRKRRDGQYGTERSLWGAILGRLRGRISGDSFRTWFAPLEFLGRSGDAIKIGVPDEVFLYQLETHYLAWMERELTDILGHPGEIEFVTLQEEDV